MNEVLLLAQLLFSEATKDPKLSDNDATAIAWVVKNRLSNPERFGSTLQEVVFSPYQFTGVGSPEWEKITTNKTTEDEQGIFKRYLQIASGVLRGNIPDPTEGADHYFNPKLASPSWAKKMKKTYTSEAHDYYKE